MLPFWRGETVSPVIGVRILCFTVMYFDVSNIHSESKKGKSIYTRWGSLFIGRCSQKIGIEEHLDLFKSKNFIKTNPSSFMKNEYYHLKVTARYNILDNLVKRSLLRRESINKN